MISAHGHLGKVWPILLSPTFVGTYDSTVQGCSLGPQASAGTSVDASVPSYSSWYVSLVNISTLNSRLSCSCSTNSLLRKTWFRHKLCSWYLYWFEADTQRIKARVLVYSLKEQRCRAPYCNNQAASNRRNNEWTSGQSKARFQKVTVKMASAVTNQIRDHVVSILCSVLDLPSNDRRARLLNLIDTDEEVEESVVKVEDLCSGSLGVFSADELKV